jgi:hypothetical protein
VSGAQEDIHLTDYAWQAKWAFRERSLNNLLNDQGKWERINVSLRMASVSPNSFTFTTDPGHVLYPATIRKPNLFKSLNSLAER